MVRRRFFALAFLAMVMAAFVVPSCTDCADGGVGCPCQVPQQRNIPGPCSIALCDGTCWLMERPVGAACNLNSCVDSEHCEGVCTETGECVQCLRNSDCSAGHTCEPGNVCTTCNDGVKNGDEVDVDCGGSCSLCPGTCKVDADCPGGYCWVRASKVLGDNRSVTPILLPAGAETFSDADLHSPAFIEAMRKQVWQGIAHELGLDEIPAVKLPTSAAPDSDGPSSLRKRILRRIVDSGAHLGVGATAGFIAALYWPRELPSTAKHLAMVIPIINVQNQEAMQSPAPSASVVPTVVTSVMHAAPVIAPEIDRETQALERARELIASARYSEALIELARHEKQFPQSQHAGARNRYMAIARERHARAATEAKKTP